MSDYAFENEGKKDEKERRKEEPNMYGMGQERAGSKAVSEAKKIVSL